ncbi:MAG: hypothetical protein FJ000_07390 [Actinobacteria bacterium]|nr:hypothetical protein [Actinomycetota bacterium]
MPAVGEGGNGAILVTRNGGMSWKRQTYEGRVNALNSVTFKNALDGVATGDVGVLLVTHDGGATWTRRDSGTAYSLRGSAFDPAGGWRVVGEGGTVLSTMSTLP